MTTNFQFKSSLIDYTYDGQGYSYTITPNDWTTIDIDQIAFGQFISLMSDIYSGGILAINRQRLFDHFEIKLSEIDHGPDTSVDLVTALIDITETDITSAVTPSVIFDLQTEISDTYATIASPAFTGTPTAPTAAANTNNTELATTAYADDAAATAAATAQSNAEGYADTLVINLWDDRGSYSAAGNAYPSTGGSGTAGAILKGDIWTISAAGTLGANVVEIGDTVRALVDSPSTTDANWAVGQNNIAAWILTPTINTQYDGDYTLQPVDNDGKTYLRMYYPTANEVLVPLSQTRTITIRQGDTGTTTLVADTGVTLNGNPVFSGAGDTKTLVPIYVDEFESDWDIIGATA